MHRDICEIALYNIVLRRIWQVDKALGSRSKGLRFDSYLWSCRSQANFSFSFYVYMYRVKMF